MKLLAEGLAEGWRKEAEQLRRRGANEAAQSLLSCAEDLEAAVTEWELDLLTVHEAAKELGKSPSQVWRYIQNGRLEKVGTIGTIRVKRADVIRLHPSGAI